MKRLAINPDQIMAILPAFALQAARPKRKEPGGTLQPGDQFALVELTDRIDYETEWAFTRQLFAAVENPKVREIILYVDSPGGNAMSGGRMAEAVAEANELKPVHAFVFGLSTSAAYGTICGCTSITSDRHSLIGSIGTILQLLDDSKLHEELGLKVITITTGRFKGIGASGRGIDQEDIEELQRFVNSMNSSFIATVARGRGLSVERVREDIATGQVWVASEARALGLIDNIQNERQFFKGLRARIAPEKYAGLTGKSAAAKYVELALKKSGAEYLDLVPDEVHQKLAAEFPTLSQRYAAAQKEEDEEYERRRRARY